MARQVPTITEVLSQLTPDDARREFWLTMRENIARGNYSLAIDLLLNHSHDHDFAMQVAIVASELGRGLEEYGKQGT